MRGIGLDKVYWVLKPFKSYRSPALDGIYPKLVPFLPEHLCIVMLVKIYRTSSQFNDLDKCSDRFLRKSG